MLGLRTSTYILGGHNSIQNTLQVFLFLFSLCVWFCSSPLPMTLWWQNPIEILHVNYYIQICESKMPLPKTTCWARTPKF